MTINSLRSTKNPGSNVIRSFVSWLRAVRLSLKSLVKLFASGLRWILAKPVLFQTILSVPPAFGNMTSFACSLRAWISGASKISTCSMSATMMSPFHILPARNTHQEDSSQKFSYQTGGVLTGLWQKSDDAESSIRTRNQSWANLTCSPNRGSQGVFPSDKRS